MDRARLELFRDRFGGDEETLRHRVGEEPSALAWQGLAEYQLARGALDEADHSFLEAMQLAPDNVEIRLGRTDLTLWREGLGGWERRIDEGIALHLPPPPGFHFLIRKACLHWIARRVHACAVMLAALSAALERDGEALARALQGYTMSLAGHLDGLVRAELSGRGALYGQEDLPPLFLAGDSHCIAPAGSLVSFDGEMRRVIPAYVLGCKAWHLANSERNQYKECAERIARVLPKGASLLFSAGDIDCRYESGFHNLFRKTGADLDEAIPHTVEGYLDALQRMFAAASVRLMVLAPPAPRRDVHKLGPGDQLLLPTIAARFHDALVAGCATRGIPLVDYYALTVADEGWSDARHHVDGHHLYADALRLALGAVKT